MPARMDRLVAALFLAALLASAAPASAAKVYRAEQFSVRMEIQPGGALHVTETIRFAFGPDSFTYVYREVPERRTDGVVYVGASMDGVPMDRGNGPGQFEIRKRDNGRRRVVFHFAPVTSSTHTFTLTYVAEGVVRQEADADVLAWQILPTDHDYAIDRADAEIVAPAGATVVGFALPEPDVRGLRTEGTTMRLSRAGLGRDEEWPITIRFARRTVAAVPPRLAAARDADARVHADVPRPGRAHPAHRRRRLPAVPSEPPARTSRRSAVPRAGASRGPAGGAGRRRHRHRRLRRLAARPGCAAGPGATRRREHRALARLRRVQVESVPDPAHRHEARARPARAGPAGRACSRRRAARATP